MTNSPGKNNTQPLNLSSPGGSGATTNLLKSKADASQFAANMRNSNLTMGSIIPEHNKY